MHDQLEAYLESLARDECYRVDATLKQSPHETTERVFFVGANGAEQGPFIRKRLDVESGMGSAYWRLWQAQQQGRRFAHLPYLIDCYSTESAFVVVMEHVAGETLAETIYCNDPSPALAYELFPAICDAVIELHERFDPPMIHRDLKPSNIMICNGEVTVIDLGIAREYDNEASADTHQFGTRNYAPPEQFGYGQTDVRSDVYALGMILYYCLTEKTPNPATARSGFTDTAVPDALRPVLARATAFDPAARFASVRDLRNACVAASANTPTTQHHDAPTNNTNASSSATPPTPHPSAVQPLSTPMQDVPEQAYAAPTVPTPSLSTSATSTPQHARDPILVGLGRAWNIFLAVTWILFFLVTTTMIQEPAPTFAKYPVWMRPIAGYGVFAVAGGLLCWLLADKRRIRDRLPRPLRLDTIPAKALCACLVIIIAFAAVGLAEFTV